MHPKIWKRTISKTRNFSFYFQSSKYHISQNTIVSNDVLLLFWFLNMIRHIQIHKQGVPGLPQIQKSWKSRFSVSPINHKQIEELLVHIAAE